MVNNRFKSHIGIAVAVIFLSTPAVAQSRTYKLIPSESSFWVFAGKAGFLSAFAHDHEIGVKSYTSTVTIPESGAAGASMQLEVDAKSLVVLDKKVSEKDRRQIFDDMHSSVLESDKHPVIGFRSVSVSNLKKTGENRYNFTLNGDLKLHGVTRRIALQVSATITATEIRASGKYPLKQTDYGIRPYSAAGGTVKVKNEVIINFSIVARS